MKIGVIRFPGTNNEHETMRALDSFEGVQPTLIEHYQPERLDDVDGLYIPGGFSYGDVLRAGAIAKTTPIMKEIIKAVSGGMPAIGICNGFQILTEAGLVKGVLMPNRSTRFVCKFVNIKISENETYLNNLAGRVMRLPIAHFEGNLWYPQPESLKRNAIAQYSSNTGEIVPEANPNGSVENIAGLANEKGTAIGMMPHPERAVFKYQGSTDGRAIIGAFLEEVKC